MEKSMSFASFPTLLRALVALALLAAAVGCDWLSDATTFTVDTDWKQITLDADTLGIAVAGGTVPAVSCTPQNDICAQASSGISCNAQTYGCVVQCGQNTCEIVASAEVNSTVDLSEKIKSQTSASALSKVSFQRMVYNTEVNTLNFDTPVIDIFVGPGAAATTTDAGVIKLATMPSIPKGQIVNDLLNATEEGKNKLSDLVKDYQNPFKFFVKATLRFASGAEVPKGKLTLKLKAYFEIEPL